MKMTDTDSKTTCISEHDRALTVNALEEFNNNNYGTCIQNLVELESSIGVDPCIIHNKAVAEFYKSDFKNYEQFHKVLNQLIGKAADSNNYEFENVKMATVYFNKAVLLFQMRQHQAALKIMFAVMKHIDKLDDKVVQRAGLLTVNLLLNTNQPKKADALVELLQTRLNISSESLTSDEDDDSDVSRDKKKEKSVKSLDYFKWMFRLYKTRSNVLNGKNLLIPNEDTSEISILRGHQYYNGIDYQMAAKELSKNFTNLQSNIKKNGEDHNTVIANNMGIIHFHVRHYAMAARFFQHSLTFDQTAMESVGDSPPLQSLGATKRPEILYNLGIAMLHLQRPKEAFECLLIPLNYYHNNPRLWLRLADACIMVHTQNLKDKENKNIVSAVVGSGSHRKYIIQRTSMKYVSDESQSFAIPSTNLEFASLCLRNTITLIDHHCNEIKKTPSTAANTDWTQIDERNQCNPSKPLNMNTINKLKCAALCKFSYVQLCLGEYLLALKSAKELLQLTYLPDVHAMLGHMYSAEALVMLDRITEARTYLEPKFIAELKEDDFIHRGSPDWNINTKDAAQSILKYNLAVTLVLQGEIELAKSMMSTCKHPIVYGHLKMLKMYMELQSGNVENCRKMVKIDTPQHS
ncbi:CCR4-NOT transcription complex subunit 10 [Bradysia coprophila]|uniref:CCR4-NOT transcription complex subunit 10 n=1 Tax=Bradysia coprophila TaxID=38358 RepID=UPI00187DD86A|nr:CCR4-NOT transcription complex subunit 10 [Bradysia coprophila]